MYLTGYNYENYDYLLLENNQNTIKSVNLTGGFLRIHSADRTDTLFLPLQFHFHAPSEHTVDNKFFDAEI